MKKQSWLIVLCLLLLVVFTGCGHEHSYGRWETERKATCQKEGLKVRECDCGDEETERVPKLAHEYGQWNVKKPATCTAEGLREHTCENCGFVEEEAVAQTKENTYTATQLYDLYINSVGEIVTYDKRGQSLSLGSCFVQTADGKLVTNYHVIDGAYCAKVSLGGQTYDIEKVLAYDKDIDAAVLKISATGLTPVTICEQEHKAGETVYAFGNSKGLTSTFSDGMITYAKRAVDGVTYVQHSAPISTGNSGGPLINTYGEVIGINTMTMKDSQNLNFAVCIAELKNLDYSKEMTMSQFYDTECNAYKRLVNYTMEKGTWSESSYALTLNESYSSDYKSKYSTLVMYFPDDQELWICMSIDAEEYAYFIVDENLTGIYDWGYFDDDDYSMSGTLYASTFRADSYLSYTDNNIANYSIRSAIQELASAMIGFACGKLTSSLTDCGVTAADLGFANF